MDPALQVRVKSADRVRIVQMAPEVEQPAAPEAPAADAAAGNAPKGGA
jgi:NADH-quinone oxidoreductase subunit J